MIKAKPLVTSGLTPSIGVLNERLGDAMRMSGHGSSRDAVENARWAGKNLPNEAMVSMMAKHVTFLKAAAAGMFVLTQT